MPVRGLASAISRIASGVALPSALSTSTSSLAALTSAGVTRTSFIGSTSFAARFLFFRWYVGNAGNHRIGVLYDTQFFATFLNAFYRHRRNAKGRAKRGVHELNSVCVNELGRP